MPGRPRLVLICRLCSITSFSSPPIPATEEGVEGQKKISLIANQTEHRAHQLLCFFQPTLSHK